ncbi:hypothetical protein AYO44_08330 [Planctomycetaceae bacterium SCGC AG-212-F19]|nr:hypothetical protein AYO44_08330 [Planctomycetaceae bacterium SCGC AG-212-F19]
MRLFWLLIPLMLVWVPLQHPATVILFVAGRDTVGQVVDSFQPTSAGFRPADMVYVFEFEDDEGKLHRGADEVPFAKANFANRLVFVRYLPGRPSMARLKMNVNPIYLIVFLLGLGLALFGLWTFIREYRFEKQLRREEESNSACPLSTYQGYGDLRRVTYWLYENTLRIREFAIAVIVPVQAIEPIATKRWMRPWAFWPALGVGAFCGVPIVAMLWGSGLSEIPHGLPFFLMVGGAFALVARSWRRQEFLVYPIQGGGAVWLPTGYDGFDSFVKQLEQQVTICRQSPGGLEKSRESPSD